MCHENIAKMAGHLVQLGSTLTPKQYTYIMKHSLHPLVQLSLPPCLCSPVDLKFSKFCPICNFSNLFPHKWPRMTQNGQFYPMHNFSNLFPPKWLRMTQNGQFHLICNFSNLFPPKWLRMTWNGQFHLIHNFSNLFPLK